MTILSIEQIAKNHSEPIDSPAVLFFFKEQFLDGKYKAVGLKQDYYITAEAYKELQLVSPVFDEWFPESEEKTLANKAKRKEILATKITFEEAYQICLKEYKESLVEKHFVKPIVLFNKALFIQATFRAIKNEKRNDFGLYHGFTDSHYQPFWDIFNFNDFCQNLEDINQKLKTLGFFAVKDGFDQNSIDDLKEIKPLLSQEWIDAYNNQ